MESSVNQRIVYLIAKLSLGNAKEFSHKIDFPYSTFQHYVNPGKLKMPSSLALIKILEAYPEINGNWLLTGEGEAFEKEASGGTAARDYKELYADAKEKINRLESQVSKLTDSVHFLSKSVGQG